MLFLFRYQYAIKRIPASIIGKFQKVFDQLRIHLLLNLSRYKFTLFKFKFTTLCICCIKRMTIIIKLKPINEEPHKRMLTNIEWLYIKLS